MSLSSWQGSADHSFEDLRSMRILSGPARRLRGLLALGSPRAPKLCESVRFTLRRRVSRDESGDEESVQSPQ